MRTLRGRLRSELVWHLLGFALISVLAVWLYFPYLENPLVFDDTNLFHTDILTTAAIAPWEVGIRGLPYFTVGWVETQIGSMQAHRWVSLALHVLVAYQMFRFLEELLVASEPLPPSLAANLLHVRWIAGLVATAFVCHPVAVYGAGYLVQRTIVFAALFALLCLRALLQALVQNRLSPAVWAAVWASLSILSKQHAALLPIAALALIPVVGRWSRDTVRTGSVFLLLCLPAMLLAVLTSLSVVGQVYESSIKDLETELYSLPQFLNGYEKWLLSASTQARLFLAYWQQWLWPDPGLMSADLRVDFLRPWTHQSAWAWIIGFLSLPVLATAWSVRTHHARLVAFALTFACVLFLVELASVRFQEPYVLYRSYLWAIGYCTFVAALAYRLPPRVGIGILVLVIPLLFFQSLGRLDTFRSKLALWDDAAAKLPKLEIAGSSRILFNRGGERFRSGQPDGAMEDINQAIRLNPPNGRFRVARAVALLGQGRAGEALADLEAARRSIPTDPHLLYVRSRALRALGRLDEADVSLLEAARQGSFPAKYEIARKRSPTGDVTVNLRDDPP
ncbi:MAG: hypothetical protein IPO43_03305 [Rhodoferax sp.]|nr:hypothetical protein [Rhodoferax sp.]